MKATVICDASHCPETKASGWAAWLTLESGVRKTFQGSFICEKSCLAEAQAARNAVHIAYGHGARDILLQSDCKAVEKILPEFSYLQGLTIKFRHVKGHTQRPERRYWVNRWCDTEAKREMKAFRDGLKN